MRQDNLHECFCITSASSSPLDTSRWLQRSSKSMARTNSSWYIFRLRQRFVKQYDSMPAD